MRATIDPELKALLDGYTAGEVPAGVLADFLEDHGDTRGQQLRGLAVLPGAIAATPRRVPGRAMLSIRLGIDASAAGREKLRQQTLRLLFPEYQAPSPAQP